MKTRTALAAALLCSALTQALAQTTQVDWTNFSSVPATQNALLFRDASGTPLSQGSPVLNTDGMLVQLGFFAGSTTANNFTGTWTPITGATFAQFPTQPARTAIGDSPDLTGSGNGVITFNTTFTQGSNEVRVYAFDPDGIFSDPGTYTTLSSISINNVQLPNGQVLAIRFYDSTNDTGSYNTVSADNWLWQAPTVAGSIVNINLAANFTGSGGAAALEFEDAANPFLTTVPEPSTYALILLGLGSLAYMRRRRQSRS